MQALPAQPESLCIVEMGGVEKQDELGEKGTIGFLYLNIGLQVDDLLENINRKIESWARNACEACNTFMHT